jgi:hypothetical protein
MSYKEIYELSNELYAERLELVEERIEQIIREPAIEPAFADYFTSVAKCINTIKNHSADKEFNDLFYSQFDKENYEKSYANPAYAVKVLGDEYGQLLSAVYAKIAGSITRNNRRSRIGVRSVQRNCRVTSNAISITDRQTGPRHCQRTRRSCTGTGTSNQASGAQTGQGRQIGIKRLGVCNAVAGQGSRLAGGDLGPVERRDPCSSDGTGGQVVRVAGEILGCSILRVDRIGHARDGLTVVVEAILGYETGLSRHNSLSSK